MDALGLPEEGAYSGKVFHNVFPEEETIHMPRVDRILETMSWMMECRRIKEKVNG